MATIATRTVLTGFAAAAAACSAAAIARRMARWGATDDELPGPCPGMTRSRAADLR